MTDTINLIKTWSLDYISWELENLILYMQLGPGFLRIQVILVHKVLNDYMLRVNKYYKSKELVR